MKVSAFLLPLVLTACASVAPISPAARLEEATRPRVGSEDLPGRWAIVAINGQAASGAWLEFGAERPPVITRRPDGGFNIGVPGAPTTAFLGCNWLHLNGWTRHDDKVVLGINGSSQTERGCDGRIMRQEEQGYTILRLPMKMALTSLGRVRLENENGTVDLAR